MGSSFFELNVATSGIFTAKGALLTVAHNVANAEVKGFSRQYVEMRASRPLALNNGRGMVGTGSEIYGVGQMRSFYLDKKYWSEMPVLGEYSIKNIQLSLVERSFSELQGVGFKGAMDDFFSTLSDLSTNSGDPTYRMNTLQSASTLATLVTNTATQLQNQQFDLNGEVKTMVEIINSLGVQISTLNKQIYLAEIDGSSANDLRDQRALLVDELSQFVNVTVYEEEMNKDFALGKFPNPEDRSKSDKRFTVLINGQVFVDHYDFFSLRIEPRSGYTNPTDIPSLYDIYWNGSNSKFDIYSPTLSGQLKGLIDMRDGNNGNKGYGTIAGYTVSGTTGTLTISNLSRTDYPPAAGKVTLVGPNGVRYDLEYETYDSITGEFTFDTAKVPASFATNQTNWRVEVGSASDFKGIPHYLNKLDNLVRTFAKAMNDVFLSGYDSYGNQATVPMFTSNDPAYNQVPLPADFYDKLNCLNFQVNPKLFADPRLFAAADDASGGVSDNGVIFKLMDIKDDTNLFKEGKLGDYIVGIALELGIDAKQANNFDASYTDVTVTVNNQRKAIMDVSTDEEMTNMLLFQQMFGAASKLINVINDIYDTLINQVRP